MTRLVYLPISALVFFVAVALHVMSYGNVVPTWALQAATAVVLLLCFPLVMLFIRIKKQIGTTDVWRHFWQKALERCPRWIWGSMSIAIMLMWGTGASAVFFDIPKVTFQTAALLIPAAAALSYAVTLWRSNESS